MKRFGLLLLTMMLVLTGCNKGFEFSENETKDNSEHAAEVFGVKFDKNHTWSSTKTGEVTVIAEPEVEKVQILAYTSVIDEEGDEVTSLNVLNEVAIGNETTVKLKYDAPEPNLGLFAAFITNSNYIVREINGNTVSMNRTRALTRALPEGITLPTGEFTLEVSEEPFEAQRGWVPGELLYGLSSYGPQKMSCPEYSQEYLLEFRAMVFSYFKNKEKNLPLVKSSGYYNDKIYPITTGKDPIIVSPVYKQDKAQKYGNEVYNSDLYYYYFKESELGADPVAYIQSLPKYKAFPMNEVFSDSEDDVISKRCSYALMYYGDGQPVLGETKGSYQFPAGYKIGFMVRAKSTTESGKKQGELYADGRLNNQINAYPKTNFRSSQLGPNGPRAAWLTLDGRMLLCWESGTDSDFNDFIMEVEGGVEGIIIIPDPVYNVYTYCFEDTEDGDYDINDIVIKAKRINNTIVEYSLIACGAYDEIFIRNLNAQAITDGIEVHHMFGAPSVQTFINTERGAQTYAPITVQKVVDAGFSLTDPNTQPYIYNKTKNLNVRMSKTGEDPHGIMIPNDFRYPLEKTCIKDAYLEFNNWGVNPVTSTDWYTKPETDKVY